MGFLERFGFRSSPPEMSNQPEEQNKQEQAVPAEAPAEAPEPVIVPELGMTQEEFDKLTPEEQTIQKGRVHNPEEAHTVGRHVNAEIGRELSDMEKATALSEKIGQEPHDSREFIDKLAAIKYEAAEQKANLALKEAMEKNVMGPIIAPLGALSEGEGLQEFLRKDESALLRTIKDVSVADLELIARKAKELMPTALSELQTLEEPRQSGSKKYDVAVIDETNDFYTMVTNGDGSEIDQKPRVFKITKKDFADKGYKLSKNTEYKSIYNQTNNNPEASANKE